MIKAHKSPMLTTVLLCCCVYLAAQSDPSPYSLSILANVIDRNGRPVRDLTKAQFQIKVDGRQVAHLEATYSVAPRRIVVLLDMSGSMSGEIASKKWEIAREAVKDLLEDTPDDVSIALVPFSNQVHDVFDFSQSRNSMAEWLKEGSGKHGSPQVHGRTALFDALQTSAKLFVPPYPGDALYLISDAGDNSSHVGPGEVRELLVRSQIRLFVFLFGDPIPVEDEESETREVKEIARVTGGIVFGVPSYYRGVQGFESWQPAFHHGERMQEKIKLYTQLLNTQVNGFYTLRFDLPSASGKKRKVSLNIVDDGGKPRKDVAFTYSTLLPQPK